jgi:hypothetical protein
VRLLPDAIVELDDLNVADPEFHDFRRARDLLSEGRSYELKRPVETEGGAGSCR